MAAPSGADKNRLVGIVRDVIDLTENENRHDHRRNIVRTTNELSNVSVYQQSLV